jgi:hypothetical protein
MYCYLYNAMYETNVRFCFIFCVHVLQRRVTKDRLSSRPDVGSGGGRGGGRVTNTVTVIQIVVASIPKSFSLVTEGGAG